MARKKQIKILHLRGRNSSEYGRVGLYSGNELPKEYRGVGKLFDSNPNVQQLTIISTNEALNPDDGNTEEDVFRRRRETDHSLDAAHYLVMPEPTTTDNGDGTYSHKFASPLETRKLNNGEAM